MAISVTLTGTTVTLDETAGLQNDDTNTALPARPHSGNSRTS